MNKETLITFGVAITTMDSKYVRPLVENDFELFQRVVECYGVAEDGWLKIKATAPLGVNPQYYEIDPDRFIKTFTPKFLKGETVYIPRKSCEAIVYGISWHFKREEYIYSLMINNKRNSRRYFVDELEKVDGLY